MADTSVQQVISVFKRATFEKSEAARLSAQKDPQYAAAAAERRDIFKRILRAGEDGAELARLEELDALQKEIIKKYSLKPGCGLCGDIGYTADGKMCRCLKKEIYERCFGAYDINAFAESFAASDLSRFDDVKQISLGQTARSRYHLICENVKEYISRFPENKKFNVLLSGAAGLGKSFLMRCMAKELQEKGADVMFVSAIALAAVFHSHRLGKDVDLSYPERAQVLFIDDLGAEPVTHNVTVEYTLRLIEERIISRRHTVIATNLADGDLISRYGERLYSRLMFKDICRRLLFEGSDLRI